jgi:hypothetical protein
MTQIRVNNEVWRKKHLDELYFIRERVNQYWAFFPLVGWGGERSGRGMELNTVLLPSAEIKNVWSLTALSVFTAHTRILWHTSL